VLFDVYTPSETSKLPICPDNPVAGNDNGNRVCASGLPYRSHRPGTTHLDRNIPIGARRTVGDLHEGSPSLHLEGRASQIQLSFEFSPPTLKILFQLTMNFFMVALRILNEHITYTRTQPFLNARSPSPQSDGTDSR
jgi:hypothetical protein